MPSLPAERMTTAPARGERRHRSTDPRKRGGGVGVGGGEKRHPSTVTARGLRGVPRVCLIPTHAAFQLSRGPKGERLTEFQTFTITESNNAAEDH